MLMSERSSGILFLLSFTAFIAPIAVMSFPQKIAVILGLFWINIFVFSYPLSADRFFTGPTSCREKGIFLGDADREARLYAVKKMKEIIEFAAEVGGMVSLGLVMGGGVIGAEQEEKRNEFFKRFVESCEMLLKISVPLGVDLVVEPMNRYETDNLKSSQEALTFIEKTGLPLYLMLDTFHMNIEDVNLIESFQMCMPYTKHIHFLDSNRLAPGMGHLNMEEIYRILERQGYGGFLCLEALPIPSGMECARRGAEFFRYMTQ